MISKQIVPALLAIILSGCTTIGQGKRTIQVFDKISGEPAANRHIAWRHTSIVPHFPAFESPVFFQLDKEGRYTRVFPFTDGVFYLCDSAHPEDYGHTEGQAWVNARTMKDGGRVDFRLMRTTKEGSIEVAGSENGIQLISTTSTHYVLITKNGEQGRAHQSATRSDSNFSDDFNP